VLVCIGAGFWAYGSAPFNVRDRFFPKNLAEVEPGWLYRSGQISPNLIEDTLRNLKIDVIVDLTPDRGDRPQLAEKQAAQHLGIRMRRFPMDGSGIGTVESYVNAIAEIARAERSSERVLVHCRAGDRRSGSVIAVYELLVKGVPPERARREVERFNRDPGDQTKLKRFFAEYLDDIARGLVDARVIDHLPEARPFL
jgi:protein tyrosine phosphatase (PTP) superfamily phosphohydrolase (DUF442 family)